MNITMMDIPKEDPLLFEMSKARNLISNVYSSTI